MISPQELKDHIDMLRASGVVGRVKIGDIEVTISPAPVEGAKVAPRRSAKAEYDAMLFGATEGIADEEMGEP